MNRGNNVGNVVFNNSSSNPFIPTGGSKLWTKNYLLLSDEKMRKLSGVQTLDNAITDMYLKNPVKTDL